LGKAQAPRVEASQGFYCPGFIQPNKPTNKLSVDSFRPFWKFVGLFCRGFFSWGPQQSNISRILPVLVSAPLHDSALHSHCASSSGSVWGRVTFSSFLGHSTAPSCFEVEGAFVPFFLAFLAVFALAEVVLSPDLFLFLWHRLPKSSDFDPVSFTIFVPNLILWVFLVIIMELTWPYLADFVFLSF